jgi:putative FmdB family regulatory protein
MPTYEFHCPKCAVRVSETCAYEQLDPNPPCHNCDGTLIRLYNFGAVTFNGPGFYTTDKGK